MYEGYGFNRQGSYLFHRNIELTARVSLVDPDQSIESLTPQTKQYTLGTTKHLRGHRLKLQTDLTLEERNWELNPTADAKNWILRFQIEAGI